MAAGSIIGRPRNCIPPANQQLRPEGYRLIYIPGPGQRLDDGEV
jgi:hypothetical protein